MGMQINEDEALAMTSIADTSRDGLISYVQFKQICKRINHHLAKEVSARRDIPQPDSAKRNASFWQKGLPSTASIAFRSGPSNPQGASSRQSFSIAEGTKDLRDRTLNLSKSLQKLAREK